MKITMLVAIGASLGCYLSSANAQNSVTLFGVIDNGLDFTNNSGGKSLLHMQDGAYDGMGGSRWGLQGSEDLGGGLKAIFKLESGFYAQNGVLGQGGLAFGRQAWVGISDERFGSVTVGRQYDPVIDYFAPVTMPGTWGGVDTHADDIDNTAGSFRVNNSVMYTSPNFKGLTFSGMTGLTNSNAEGTSKIGLWSAGAAYSIGSFNLAAAYLFVKTPGTLLSGENQPNTTGAAIGAAGPWSYVGQPKNEQIFGAGGTYKLGSALLGLDYSNVKFDEANGTTATVVFNTYEAWGQYSFTPATTVAFAYEFTNGSIGYSLARPKYHEVNLLFNHQLSKRTQVYVSLGYELAAGAGQPADLIEGVTGVASSTNRQLAGRIGIHQAF